MCMKDLHDSFRYTGFIDMTEGVLCFSLCVYVWLWAVAEVVSISPVKKTSVMKLHHTHTHTHTHTHIAISDLCAVNHSKSHS